MYPYPMTKLPVYTASGDPSIPGHLILAAPGETARVHWTNWGKPCKIRSAPAHAGMPVEPDPLSVVTDYLSALSVFDYERARTCLDDQDFEYTSPINQFDSADDFIRHITLVSGIIHTVHTRKVFVDGADQCHILTYRIQISEKQDVTAALWTQVRGGRITRIEAIFDASLYRDLFPEGQ